MIFPTGYTNKGFADATDKVWASDGVTNFNITVNEIGTEVFADRTTSNLAEGTNKYYTEARVSANSTVVGKADKTNVLEKDNTTAYTPTAQYHPATKDYVDTRSLPVASTTTQGIIEIATDAEVATGTDTLRAITPKQRKDYAPRTPGTTVTRYTLPSSVSILTTSYVLLTSFTTTIGGVYKLNMSAFAINTGSGLDLYVDVGGVIPVTLSISAGNSGGGLYHIPAGPGDVIAVYGRRKSGTSNGTLDVFTITSD